MTRKQKTINNVISNVAVQVAATVSGIILPRLILSSLGSTINGLVNSINQFLAYLGLVEMGIGNASIAALYEPIAQGDKARVSLIMTSVKRKYLVSGGIYVFAVTILAFVYPLCIDRQLNYGFAFSMVMITACNSIIDFFLIGRFKVLLVANQKTFILNFAKASSTVIMTVLGCAVLIMGGSVATVKVLAGFAHLGEAIFIMLYVKHCYPTVNYYLSEYIKIGQQNNALIHQLCSVVTYNTDLVLLTLFIKENSLKEVSVYSVYALVMSMIGNGMRCFTAGIEATFGDMVAKGEEKKLQDVFAVYELCYVWVMYLMYSCFLALIIPFVRCYTGEMSDINYVRPCVGILFGINGLLANLKDTHGLIIKACGCYRQTQIYVIAEAVVNITLSILWVHSFGMLGVLVGTVLSHLITAIGMPWYADKYLLKRDFRKTMREHLSNLTVLVVLVGVEIGYVYAVCDWVSWLMSSVCIFFLNAVAFGWINVVLNYGSIKLGVKFLFNKRAN